MNKKDLTERDICTKFITPNIEKTGWDVQSQIREEVYFTKGRIIVRGKLVTRGKAKRADYILYYKPNIPIALIEAKVTSAVNSATIGVPILLGFDCGCIHDGYLAFPYFPESELLKGFFFILCLSKVNMSP